MLPGLLAANAAEGVGPTGAALALLDFRKAYDTIDRGFLLEVMEAVGVSDGVLAWTRTILTQTYASAEGSGVAAPGRARARAARPLSSGTSALYQVDMECDEAHAAAVKGALHARMAPLEVDCGRMRAAPAMLLDSGGSVDDAHYLVCFTPTDTLPWTPAHVHSWLGANGVRADWVVQYRCGADGLVPVQWHGAAQGQGPVPSVAWLSAREPGFVASVHGGHAFVSKAVRALHVECRQRTDAPSFCRLRVSRLPLSMVGPARAARAAEKPGGPPPGEPMPEPPPGGPPPGDFNFVESPRDRARSEGDLEWRDRAPAAAMAAMMENAPLRDAYRLVHPSQRGYTFSAHNAQARLDRLYVSPTLVPRVFGCDAADREAVLGAVRTHSLRVPQAVAEAAGALVVTPAEMLPGLLAANAAEGVGPTGAALALLDFRKAYDTIDRGFLLEVMEAVGVSDGVLAWTRTILTQTYASAEVNGFISAPRLYAAGVRQGCPAAPALFLFLGHALACFLRTCPAVGVEIVPGCRVTCPQYADDCMPLLRSCAPADVAALVEAMAVLGRATGLILNLGKCGILPMGSAGEGLLAGAEVAGLRVLDAGVSLGMPVADGLPPPEGATGVCPVAAGLVAAAAAAAAEAAVAAAAIAAVAAATAAAAAAETEVMVVWLLQPPTGVRDGVWAVVAALVVDAMERGRRHLWRITRPRDGVMPPDRSMAVERAGALATVDLWDALASFAEGGVMPRGWAGLVGPIHPFVGVVDGGLTLNKTS
ncbi:hypothetical protein FOA52_002637 [Chlamydomonas sp. UWO 241]|nr:hypothetical protein FOA52_002637 [Chlamydomonas sp. UWO 241]